MKTNVAKDTQIALKMVLGVQSHIMKSKMTTKLRWGGSAEIMAFGCLHYVAGVGAATTTTHANT